jgi:hypothetical protein
MNTILITCKNDDCERTFRIPEYVRPNSTIKSKPSQECRICINKALLGKATLYDKNNNSTSKYPSKANNGRKRAKTPHNRFYTSTAWKWFSRYILLYYSIDGTAAKCCTCGTIKRLNDKELHTGHWIKVFDANSTNYGTAFEFTNIGPQCSKCNNKRGGCERLMQVWLTKKHGAEEVERLHILSKHPFSLDDYTLSKIAEEYRIKFNELLKNKGWNNPWKK